MLHSVETSGQNNAEIDSAALSLVWAQLRTSSELGMVPNHQKYVHVAQVM